MLYILQRFILFFMITKKTIKMLEGAMCLGTRLNTGNDYYFFSDDVDEKLHDLFRKNYTINDLDYEIFSKAIDMICEVFEDCNGKDLREYIQDNYTEFASIMTYDRLQYLNNSNDDEISSIMREYDLATVSQACAIWYDEQVQNAIRLILEAYE